MDKKREPGIYLLTDTGSNVEIILTWMDGQETRLPRQSPAEALVDFVGFDFGDYRSQVEELWEEHCVFEERDEVPYADYEDFAAQAVPLAEQLHAAAPAAYWDVQRHIALPGRYRRGTGRLRAACDADWRSGPTGWSWHRPARKAA